MKKWRCTICGYIHEGDTPPEECPLCKAPAEMFEEVVEEAESDAAPEVAENEDGSGAGQAEPEGGEPTPSEATAEPDAAEELVAPAPQEKKSSSRNWKCTVCGYIENGDAPPKDCPICKAKPDKFSEVDAEGNPLEMAGPKVENVKPTSPQKPSLIARMLMALHLHPITVHAPNGILPVAVIFLALAIFFGMGLFETAAYFNLVAVLITMPVVLLTGFVEWKNRYRGAKTFIFFMKIFCSVIVSVSLVILVAWRFFDPAVATADSPYRMIYFGIAVVMLAATGLAGHLGGKLIFGPRDKMMKK